MEPFKGKFWERKRGGDEPRKKKWSYYGESSAGIGKGDWGDRKRAEGEAPGCGYWRERKDRPHDRLAQGLDY